MGNKELPLFDIDGTLMKAGNSLHHKAFDLTFECIFGFVPDTHKINVAGMLDRQIVNNTADKHRTTESFKSTCVCAYLS